MRKPIRARPSSRTRSRRTRSCFPTAARQASRSRRQLQEALKYAACIRSHGMPNYPDPKLSSDGGIAMGEARTRLSFRPPKRRVDNYFRSDGPAIRAERRRHATLTDAVRRLNVIVLAAFAVAQNRRAKGSDARGDEIC